MQSFVSIPSIVGARPASCLASSPAAPPLRQPPPSLILLISHAPASCLVWSRAHVASVRGSLVFPQAAARRCSPRPPNSSFSLHTLFFPLLFSPTSAGHSLSVHLLTELAHGVAFPSVDSRLAVESCLGRDKGKEIITRKGEGGKKRQRGRDSPGSRRSEHDGATWTSS